MKKIIIRTIMAVLLILFVGSISAILLILKQYRDDEEVYGQAAVRFTLENDQKEEAKGGSSGSE